MNKLKDVPYYIDDNFVSLEIQDKLEKDLIGQEHDFPWYYLASTVSKNYDSYNKENHKITEKEHFYHAFVNDGEYNSDLVLARLRQFVSTGNTGDFEYNIRAGAFLQQKDIAFMDYLHANGNQLRFLPEDNTGSFGLLDYYTLSTNDKYAEAHFQHNFKGFLFGKIPLINKLNYHLVVGAKGLFTSGNQPYSEYSVGLDNIGFGKWRFLRVDYVRSNFNGIQRDGFLFGITLFD